MKSPSQKHPKNHVHRSKPFFTQAKKEQTEASSQGADRPFFNPAAIQPKLTVGEPDDRYEQEADAMADQVVQRLSQNQPPANDPTSPSSHVRKGSFLSSIQQKPEAEESGDRETQKETSDAGESLMRKPVFPKAETQQKPKAIQAFRLNSQPVIRPKVEETSEEEHLQASVENSMSAPVFASGDIPPDENPIQRNSSRSAPPVTPNLESKLDRSKGGGNPMESGTRQDMESAFDTDFSGVRLHTDAAAVQMNQELGAQAFTHGNDVYFNEGKHDTGSTEGKRLMAHELTHVVQQGGGRSIQNNIQRKFSLNQETTGKRTIAELNYQTRHGALFGANTYKIANEPAGKGRLSYTQSVRFVQGKTSSNVIYHRIVKVEGLDGGVIKVMIASITKHDKNLSDSQINRIKTADAFKKLEIPGKNTSTAWRLAGFEADGSTFRLGQKKSLANASFNDILKLLDKDLASILSFVHLDGKYFDAVKEYTKKIPHDGVIVSSKEDLSWIIGEAPAGVSSVEDFKGNKFGNLGRVQRKKANLYYLPKDKSQVKKIIRLNKPILVLKEYKPYGWFFIQLMDSNTSGWVRKANIAFGGPTLDAENMPSIYFIRRDEKLWNIVKRKYRLGDDSGDGTRMFLNGVFLSNWMAGRKIPFVGGTKVKTLDKAANIFHKDRDKLVLKKGHAIWLPDESFIRTLRSKGFLNDGRYRTHVIEQIKQFFLDVWEKIKKYTVGIAGLVSGIVVGFVKSIVDLLVGVVDLIKMIVKSIWFIISGKLVRSIIGIVKLFDEVSLDELVSFFKSAADQFVTAAKGFVKGFLKEWNADGTWDRWYFRGKVLGYIIGEVVLAIITAGVSSIKWITKLGKVGKAILKIFSGKWDDLAKKVRNKKGVDKISDSVKRRKPRNKDVKHPDELAPGKPKPKDRPNDKDQDQNRNKNARLWAAFKAEVASFTKKHPKGLRKRAVKTKYRTIRKKNIYMKVMGRTLNPIAIENGYYVLWAKRKNRGRKRVGKVLMEVSERFKAGKKVVKKALKRLKRDQYSIRDIQPILNKIKKDYKYRELKVVWDKKDERFEVVAHMNPKEREHATVRPPIPISIINHYGTDNNERGKKVVANPLSRKGPVGSDASANWSNWEKIKKIKASPSGKVSLYVRGHLLGRWTHGSGKNAKNLTPITRKANGLMETRYEKFLPWPRAGGGFKNGNKVYRYEVSMTGSGLLPPSPKRYIKIAKNEYKWKKVPLERQLARKIKILMIRLEYNPNTEKWVENPSHKDSKAATPEFIKNVPDYPVGYKE